MSIEEKAKGVFLKVLDVKPDEIKATESLGESLGVDSTEMVEISVGLKKEFGIELANNEVKKNHTFNEVLEILKSKGAS